MKRIILLLSLLLVGSVVFADDVKVNTSRVIGPVKPMNGLNNGPLGSQFYNSDRGGAVKAVHIPYARTHDTSEWTGYGGEHTIDISAIFPDFSKNVNDPSAYVFKETDRFIKNNLAVGTEIFYRLGQRIEWSVKKYNVNPPKDFKKWAQICEHIIRHYNEGWAEGFHYNIRYWEIWNEPDIGEPMWTGTEEEFFELYKTASLHLKKCFPDLMIGGPAVANATIPFTEHFLDFAAKNRLPLDFFSWHIYTTSPEDIVERCRLVRKMLDERGFKDTESILNEWNYMKERYAHLSYRRMGSEIGASFVMAAMQLMQDESCDMMMYYCANPGASYNGLVDRERWEPTKTYYAFQAWDKLSRYGTQVDAETVITSGVEDTYATAVKGEGNKVAVLVTRYSDDSDSGFVKGMKIILDGQYTEVTGHLTDDSHIYTEIPLEIKDNYVEIVLRPNAFLIVELR
ncbi:MAG: hypothetical protein IJK96_04085 [Bacteroidales bacterium]|nr:hypothetical protein [Bacteroidales bacterium]